MKKLSDQITKIIKISLRTEAKKLLYRIISGWEQIIDPEFVYKAAPVKLSKTKEGYILWIETSSNSIANFLFYQQNIIIERIATFAAINDIKSVRIKISHIKENSYNKETKKEISYILPNYIKNSINEIEDENISAALKKISENFIPTNRE